MFLPLTKSLLAKFLSLLSILILLPDSLSSSEWFLSKTGTSFFGFFDHPPTPNPSLHAWWVLYALMGPFLALFLLLWSLIIEQEKGVSALPTGWRRWSLIGFGICTVPVALGLGIHAIAG